MNKINILYRRYRELIFRFFLFIITVGILVFFLPTERKFAFEYRKGAPWMHEDLIAPFDFAIQKDPAQLEQEQDSIMSASRIFYRFNEDVFHKTDSAYIAASHEKLTQFVDSLNVSWQKELDLEQKLDTVHFLLSELLKRGVADTAMGFEDGEIIQSALIKNNIVSDVKGGLLTQPEAINFINNHLNTVLRNFPHAKALVHSLQIDQFIKVTAVYDPTTTKDNNDKLMESLSTTSGMIQRGQRIISRGELITDHSFQIIESLRTEYESMSGIGRVRDWIIIGKVTVISVAIAVLFLFLIYFRKEVLQHRLKSSFIVFMLLLMVFAAGLTSKVDEIDIYVVPIAIMPIIIRVFYDPRLAIFVHMLTIVIIGFIVPNPFEFVFIQFVVGVIAIMSLRQMHRRQQIFTAAFAVFLTYSLVYSGLGLMQEGDITKLNPMQFAWFAGNSMLILWSYPLIYLFEKMFGFLSDVTLMELADTNHPLLRKLNEKAPGTFQHSMQVANLAEEVIRQIGGNPSLVRTGALYHDIGKMEAPEFFIENQAPGINPHDDLPFEESAQKIISHVKNGMKIAKQYNLPKPVLDFIKTHHGDSLVQYFYRSQVNKYPDEVVDQSMFQYPGPVPFSKETGVVMMADSVEAASRSLKKVTEKTIEELVDNIISYIIKEDQLREADLTFKNITVAKNIFKEKLKNIYHARIEYPEERVRK